MDDYWANFAITFLPIIIGMSIRQFVPKLSTKIEKITSISATVLLAVIILLLIIKEWSRLPNFIFQVGIGVLLLNTLSMAAGFYLSKLFNLNYKQQICISIEVGMQNGTLAIAITAGLLNNPDMAIPGAIYSLLMYLTGCIAIVYGRNFSTSRV